MLSQRGIYCFILVLLLLPVALPLILLVNLSGWLGGLLWPDWDAIKHGYVIRARKH